MSRPAHQLIRIKLDCENQIPDILSQFELNTSIQVWFVHILNSDAVNTNQSYKRVMQTDVTACFMSQLHRLWVVLHLY
jgi:hypothetical protein